MKVKDGKVVSIEYTLKGDDGKIIDSSKKDNPLSYLHGHSGLIPGLENLIHGKSVGDSFHAVIPPEDAYGKKFESMEMELPMDYFKDVEEVQVGMQFEVMNEEQSQIMTVTRVEKEKIYLDGNHPLAGQTLHFDVKISTIRNAKKEEIEHGHIHSHE